MPMILENKIVPGRRHLADIHQTALARGKEVNGPAPITRLRSRRSGRCPWMGITPSGAIFPLLRYRPLSVANTVPSPRLQRRHMHRIIRQAVGWHGLRSERKMS
jgi:hypothetical protein